MNRYLLTALIVIVVLALACGDNTSTNPPVAKVGSWSLSVNGLPSGVAGDLRLTGPNNYSRNLTGSIQINGLAIGNYLLQCNTVINGIDTLTPTPASFLLTIAQNDTVSTTVAYTSSNLPPKGSLTINITGLPTGETGYIRLSGSGITGYIEVNQTTIFDSLQGGTFLVAAYGITASDGLNYRPKVDSQTVTVSSIPASVNVEYEAQYGTVQVNVQGLPTGEDAEIRFYEDGFPGSYISIKQTFQIDSVAEGQYIVQAFEVEISGEVYRPEHYYQSVTVKGNQVSVVDVVYYSKFGSISFVVNGLPPGLFADATLDTPDLDYAISESITIDSLEEGDYTVTASDVTATDGQVYKPDFESKTVSVNGGQTTSFAINYTPKFGLVSFTITGLGSFTDADVILSGPTMDWSVLESMIIDSLEPGDYDIIASDVVDDEDEIFEPSFDSMRVTVVAGQTVNVTVNYEEKYGRLIVQISGVPINVDADVTINGDNYSRQITETTSIDSLLKGDYSITAQDVIGFDGLTYEPDEREQTVTIVGGRIKFAYLNYAAKAGWLKLRISGLETDTDADIEVSNDSGYTEYVTREIVLGPISTGPYQLLINEVIDSRGDSLRAIPDTMSIVVIGADTATADVQYIRNTKLKLYHSPWRVTSWEYGQWQVDGGNNAFDSSGYKGELILPGPHSYELDGCQPIGKDITNASLGWNASASGARASATCDINVTYNEGSKQLVMTSSGDAQSNSDISVYQALGGAWANTTLLADSSGYPPLMLAIDNPAQDSIIITMNWSYSGSSTVSEGNLNAASWYTNAGYQIDPNLCAWDDWQSRVDLFIAGAGFYPGVKDSSGQQTIILTDSHNVGFFFQNSLHAGTRTQNYGLLDLYGTSQMAVDVTVDIQVIKRR